MVLVTAIEQCARLPEQRSGTWACLVLCRLLIIYRDEEQSNELQTLHDPQN